MKDRGGDGKLVAMIGSDFREANQVTGDILMNRDLIAINQDFDWCRANCIKSDLRWFHADDEYNSRSIVNGIISVAKI